MPDRMVRLARGAEAPAQARSTISGWLDGIVDNRSVEDVKLLVSELVTNAVRHPARAGQIQVKLDLGRARVRVEVSDPGDGFRKPRVGTPPPDALGGRGLLIVDRIASRWGVTSGRPTVVWFELAL
jgi:anti-sigma regulatory factor (Ser/Thr protein kinase)